MSKKESSHLGKGLEAIFGESLSDVLEDIQQGSNDAYVNGKCEVLVKDIKPNPYQPRKKFDEAKIKELADSIVMHGVFTPILIKKTINGYELVAGERRLRASKLAKLEKIPAILVDFDDQQMMEIALLENIQREDLNAIEEAIGYSKLIDKLGYTQDQLASRIGKSREYVANLLRLLKLPTKVQEYVINKKLTMGHVRALLGLDNKDDIEIVAMQAINQGLSVRNVEKLVKSLNEPITNSNSKKNYTEFGNVEAIIQSRLQTQVRIDNKQIAIRYNDVEDLNRILELIGCLEEQS
ncbi:MAG: ParB/RepB/Spo0J family partition protein [Erysipelotrichaceae bacterium]